MKIRVSIILRRCENYIMRHNLIQGFERVLESIVSDTLQKRYFQIMIKYYLINKSKMGHLNFANTNFAQSGAAYNYLKASSEANQTAIAAAAAEQTIYVDLFAKLTLKSRQRKRHWLARKQLLRKPIRE